MQELLVDHVRQAAGRPFERPQDDCCFFAVDWVVTRTGLDPAADLRGAYDSATSAARVVVREGGFERMWRSRMEAVGLKVTDKPQVGDVGVVRDAVGQLVAGVRLETGWAIKSVVGLCVDEFETVCAWSLSYG